MGSLRKIIKEELKDVAEVVHPEDINLSSFKMRRILNPKIWESDDKIDPDVRKVLLKIADDFMDFLDVAWVKPTDITMTGSLANYNWSAYSDIDLHILFDFKEINENEELVRDFMDSKKKIWNDTHNVKIYGFEVELYGQDINQEHHSSGVFSLENNEWVTKPNHSEPDLNRKKIKDKASDIMSKIDDIIDLFQQGEYQKVLDEYEKLWDKVKKMRKAGLEGEGEFSYENMVYKVLRRTEYIDKLNEIKVKSYDALNSM